MKKFSNSIEEVINLLKDYTKMMLGASYKAKQDGTKQEDREQRAAGHKILTPKQMLRRFPIALAQVKAGEDSESLLNAITYSNQHNYKNGYYIYELKKFLNRMF